MSALHVEVTGQGELPLVLVHGWGMNAAAWGDFATGLAARYPVHRVELPGHGRSQAVGGDRRGSFVPVRRRRRVRTPQGPGG